jgi:hypothetical protein
MRIQKKNPAGEILVEYEGRVLRRDENTIIIEAFFERKSVNLLDVTLRRGDRFIEMFFTDRWYNIFKIHDREDGSLKGWYCNLGYPARISEDTLSYIDLALDLWVAPDGTQTVLDADELEGLGLNDEIKHQVYLGLEDLQSRFRTNNPPL